MYADDAIEIVKKNNGAILHERYGKQADTAFEQQNDVFRQ